MVQCSDGSLYTGVAKDLAKRIDEHNSSAAGAKYTKARRPVKLVWSKRKKNRAYAQKEESRIKKLSRAQKISLIQTDLLP
jgi:putative endonuclease